MKDQLQQILNSDYRGYVVFSGQREVAKTGCPNDAVGIALTTAREHNNFADVKVYSFNNMGEYHHTPGERVMTDFNWQRSLRELMG